MTRPRFWRAQKNGQKWTKKLVEFPTDRNPSARFGAMMASHDKENSGSIGTVAAPASMIQGGAPCESTDAVKEILKALSQHQEAMQVAAASRRQASTPGKRPQSSKKSRKSITPFKQRNDGGTPGGEPGLQTSNSEKWLSSPAGSRRRRSLLSASRSAKKERRKSTLRGRKSIAGGSSRRGAINAAMAGSPVHPRVPMSSPVRLRSGRKAGQGTGAQYVHKDTPITKRRAMGSPESARSGMPGPMGAPPPLVFPASPPRVVKSSKKKVSPMRFFAIAGFIYDAFLTHALPRTDCRQTVQPAHGEARGRAQAHL